MIPEIFANARLMTCETVKFPATSICQDSERLAMEVEDLAASSFPRKMVNPNPISL